MSGKLDACGQPIVLKHGHSLMGGESLIRSAVGWRKTNNSRAPNWINECSCILECREVIRLKLVMLVVP